MQPELVQGRRRPAWIWVKEKLWALNGGPWAKNRTYKVFGEKTMVSLMLSSHQCNQRLESNKETDGGHGSGDTSVSNQSCCSSSSDVYTRDVYRKRGRTAPYQLCRHASGAEMNVCEGRLWESSSAWRLSHGFLMLLQAPSQSVTL